MNLLRAYGKCVSLYKQRKQNVHALSQIYKQNYHNTIHKCLTRKTLDQFFTGNIPPHHNIYLKHSNVQPNKKNHTHLKEKNPHRKIRSCKPCTLYPYSPESARKRDLLYVHDPIQCHSTCISMHLWLEKGDLLV